MHYRTLTHPDYVDVHVIEVPLNLVGQTDAIRKWLIECGLHATFYPPNVESNLPGLLYFYDESFATLYELMWG
jgi:hypothetical protein